MKFMMKSLLLTRKNKLFMEFNDIDHDEQYNAISLQVVDSGIVKFLQLLNSVPGIFTRWSCQGYDRYTDGTVQPPYVSFYAEDYKALRLVVQVLEKLELEVKVVVPSDDILIPLRFYIEFDNEKHLADIISSIKSPVGDYHIVLYGAEQNATEC